MGAGRPLKFKSVKELQEKIDAYFAERDNSGLPYTITGLAIALDTTRDLLCDYENKPEFSDAIKKAKAKVADYAEQMLYMGKSAAGPIFALKNFGWSDKVEQELSGPNKGPIEANVSLSLSDAEILNRWREKQ